MYIHVYTPNTPLNTLLTPLCTKVGFVSMQLRHHSVGKLVVGAVTALGADHSFFEVHAFLLPQRRKTHLSKVSKGNNSSNSSSGGSSSGGRIGGNSSSSSSSSNEGDFDEGDDDEGGNDDIAGRVRRGVHVAVDLPLDLAEAREIIADSHLDVLVFTDLGLDVFSYVEQMVARMNVFSTIV